MEDYGFDTKHLLGILLSSLFGGFSFQNEYERLMNMPKEKREKILKEGFDKNMNKL